MSCKVRMNLNLGRRDAAHLGLNYEKCLEGEEISVSEEAAEFLIRKGLATAPKADPKEKPAVVEPTIKAVPQETAKGVSTPTKGGK